MKTVAWIGVGAMGAQMVKRLLEAGYTVHVYNRTASALEEVLALGAIAAKTPKEAALAAAVIISMVAHDEAAESVWFDDTTGAIHGVDEGDLVVESSTLTPEFVRRWATQLGAVGAQTVCAPVAGTIPQAVSGALVFFAGGEASSIKALHPLFDQMGQRVHHVGNEEDAAIVKLMVNGIFAAQVNVLGEVLGVAKASGLDLAKLTDVLNELPITSPALKGVAGLILKDFRTSLFPIRLVEKDMRYLCETAEHRDCSVASIRATKSQFELAKTMGLADMNINAIARMYLN